MSQILGVSLVSHNKKYEILTFQLTGNRAISGSCVQKVLKLVVRIPFDKMKAMKWFSDMKPEVDRK